MKSVYTLLVLLKAVAPTFAARASTTRYNDGSEGACGCGSGTPFGWQYGIDTDVYTAAGSQALFDASGSSWCGPGCGLCYKVTNLGYSACETCGTKAGANETVILMVTNLCPNAGNDEWCPPPGGTNRYGYSAHFDIMSAVAIKGNWDNPSVEYDQIECPTAAVSDWSQCKCYKGDSSTTSSTSKPPTYSTTTPTTTETPSSTPKSSPPPSSSPSGKALLYGQCGGANWTGPVSCAEGSCVYSNPWYSQCQIANALVASSPTPTDPFSTSTPAGTPYKETPSQSHGGQCHSRHHHKSKSSH